MPNYHGLPPSPSCLDIQKTLATFLSSAGIIEADLKWHMETCVIFLEKKKKNYNLPSCNASWKSWNITLKSSTLSIMELFFQSFKRKMRCRQSYHIPYGSTPRRCHMHQIWNPGHAMFYPTQKIQHRLLEIAGSLFIPSRNNLRNQFHCPWIVPNPQRLQQKH